MPLRIVKTALPEEANAPDLRPVTITLLGEPVGFARNVNPNAVGGQVRYRPIPVRQKNAFAALRFAAQQEMLGRLPIDKAVIVDFLFELPIPTSWSQKKQASAMLLKIRPTKRPDLTNIEKLCEDAFNGIVFRDDCLIVEKHSRKIYGEQPKMVITVSPDGA